MRIIIYKSNMDNVLAPQLASLRMSIQRKHAVALYLMQLNATTNSKVKKEK